MINNCVKSFTDILSLFHRAANTFPPPTVGFDVLIYTAMALNGHIISSWEHTGESQYITPACRLDIRVIAWADVPGGQVGKARGEGVYPQGLPESSEAAGGRLLHLTASRSNNCKSRFRESSPRNWSMSTGSFKAAAHFAQNRQRYTFLKAQLYLPVTLCNKLCLCGSFQKADTVCFTPSKKLKLLTMTLTAALFEWSSVFHVITNSEREGTNQKANIFSLCKRS